MNIKNAQGINKVEESARNRKRVEDYFDLNPNSSKAQACRDLNLSWPTLTRHVRAIIRDYKIPPNSNFVDEYFDNEGFAKLFITTLDEEKIKEIESIFDKEKYVYSDIFEGLDLEGFCENDSNTEPFAKYEGALFNTGELRRALEEGIFKVLYINRQEVRNEQK